MSCISVARHRCGFHRCLQQIQQDSPANRSTSCWALSAVFHCRALSHGVLCFLSWVKHCTGEFASARSRSLNSACRSPDLARQREARNLHFLQPRPPQGDAEDGWVLTFWAQLEETQSHQRVKHQLCFRKDTLADSSPVLAHSAKPLILW